MKGFIEKLEELLELGGTKRDLKRPVLLFIKFNIWFIFLSFGVSIIMYNRTRCTLVTSVKSSALAAIREVLKRY